MAIRGQHASFVAPRLSFTKNPPATRVHPPHNMLQAQRSVARRAPKVRTVLLKDEGGKPR